MDVVPINPDSMRSTGLTYPEAVLRQVDRLAYFFPDAIKSRGGLEAEEILAAFAGVSILVSMVIPAGGKKFEEEIHKLELLFDFKKMRSDSPEDRVDELENLLLIIRTTIKEFPKLNLIPPQDEDLDMATQEQLDMEFEEKVMREVRKRLKNMTEEEKKKIQETPIEDEEEEE